MLSRRRIYGKRRLWGLLLLLCLAGLIFWAAPAVIAGVAELKAELVNKVTEDWGGMGYPTGEVMLTFPDGRTLLLPYRSHLQPVVADGKVHIFVTEGAEIKTIMIYDPAKGQGQSFYPLPDDLDPYFGSPSFSPDGTRIAYYCHLGARQESGFIDRTGKMVIPLQSQWFARGKFSEGFAKVAVKWKYGFIDTTGKMVIPPRFKSVGDFSEGLAWVFVREELGFIDRTGRMAIPPQFSGGGNFSEGLAPVKQGWFLGWGFIDKTGKVVIQGKFDGAQSFSEGLAVVRINGKWGFIDKTGKIPIPPRFDLAQNFSQGLAPVEKDQKWGFIDRTGRAVIPLRYNGAGEFSEGLAAVSIGRKKAFWGFIDKTGKLVIPAKFGDAGKFQDGMAFVRLEDGKEALIDKTGKVIAPWPYKDQYPHFSGGLAKVMVEGKYGFVDTTGKMVITPQFDGAKDFSEGLAAVRLGEKGGIGVRVRSWTDWQLLWESPSYKELDIPHPLDPPVWKTNSLVEVDSIFSYPQRPLTFQVPEPGKNKKAKNEEK